MPTDYSLIKTLSPAPPPRTNAWSSNELLTKFNEKKDLAGAVAKSQLTKLTTRKRDSNGYPGSENRSGPAMQAPTVKAGIDTTRSTGAEMPTFVSVGKNTTILKPNFANGNNKKFKTIGHNSRKSYRSIKDKLFNTDQIGVNNNKKSNFNTISANQLIANPSYNSQFGPFSALPSFHLEYNTNYYPNNTISQSYNQPFVHPSVSPAHSPTSINSIVSPPPPLEPYNLSFNPYFNPYIVSSPSPPPTDFKKPKKSNRSNEIKEQLFYYFSTENLCKDIYLRSLFNDKNGGILLADLIKFNRLNIMTNNGKDIKLLKRIIKNECSSILELIDSDNAVRIHNWKDWIIRK